MDSIVVLDIYFIYVAREYSPTEFYGNKNVPRLSGGQLAPDNSDETYTRLLCICVYVYIYVYTCTHTHIHTHESCARACLHVRQSVQRNIFEKTQRGTPVLTLHI